MDRRSSLKALALGSLSSGVLLDACNPETEKAPKILSSNGISSWDASSGRQPEEVDRDKKLESEKFFSDHEMATIAILADIIIPADKISGSATDAKVPEFIEFIVKDMPDHQVPMRGGLSWLDYECRRRFNNAFSACAHAQQMQVVDDIAWPEKATLSMAQGVAFFSLMRNLTATGFFSSKIGIADIGYQGNSPNVWDGVPDDVLRQYGVSYDAKTLEECVKAEDHDKLFTFAEEQITH
jgi:gluconate 2-dehydrogenase gamma chain